MSRAIVFAYHNVGVRCLSVLLAHGVDVLAERLVDRRAPILALQPHQVLLLARGVDAGLPGAFLEARSSRQMVPVVRLKSSSSQKARTSMARKNSVFSVALASFASNGRLFV